jgi:hypothetical protein
MEKILNKTRVTICTERDVYNSKTLLREFYSISSDMLSQSLFVAIVVGHIGDNDHGRVMKQYGIANCRGSGMFLDSWPWRLWIWNVTIDGIKFLVFGPHSVIEECERSRNCPDHQVLVEEMVYAEMLHTNDASVFDWYTLTNHVHPVQNFAYATGLQHQTPVRSHGDWGAVQFQEPIRSLDNLKFRKDFDEQHEGRVWAPGERFRVMEVAHRAAWDQLTQRR